MGQARDSSRADRHVSVALGAYDLVLPGTEMGGRRWRRPLRSGRRRYLLAGLVICGMCGRRMESAWPNGKAAYWCRHGHASATPPGPRRAKNTCVR